MKTMQWILASASPRRKELLRELIAEFDVLPSQAEEAVEGNPVPSDLVKMLAVQKAAEVASRAQAKGKCVLGSDTVVALDNKVLGKPKNEAEAKEMLTALSGRAHEVFTGVCIYYPTADGWEYLVDSACTKVYFLPLTEEEISNTYYELNKLLARILVLEQNYEQALDIYETKLVEEANFQKLMALNIKLGNEEKIYELYNKFYKNVTFCLSK